MTTSQQKHSLYKYLIYITTACSTASFAGLIGAYAMIKKQMSDEYGFQEAFLGVCDGMGFLGTGLGYLFLLLKPIKTPRRDFLINSLICALSLTLIPLTQYFQSYAQLTLILSNLISGFSRSYMIVPYMIIIQYFDAAIQNKITINFWCSFSVLGDVLAVFCTSYMLNNISMDWKVCFYVNIGTFMFFIFVNHIATEQINMNQNSTGTGTGKNNNITIDDTWKQTRQFLSTFMTEIQNILWVIDYAFVSSLYFSILMWFPYYFLHLGYQYQASIVSIMYPIFTCIGVLVYQYPIMLCPSKAHIVISCMLGINSLFYIIMANLGHQKKQIIYYIILVAASGLVKGGPYPTITSSQMRLRTKTNREIYFAMTMGKISTMLLTIFLMIVIGILMQLNLRSFLYVLSVSTCFNFLLNLFRNLYFGPASSKQGSIGQDKNIESLDPLKQIQNKQM